MAATAICRARGIGVAHVLAGGDHDPAGNEGGVLPRRHHRRTPVQGGVRVVAAHGLDEGAHRLVVAVAGPVVGQQPLLCGGGHRLGAQRRPVRDRRRRGLEHVQRLPRVAPGQVEQGVSAVLGQAHPAGQAGRIGQCPLDDGAQVVGIERIEPVDPHPAQERRIELVVRVLGGGPQEGDGAVLDVGQEGVLLGLVEPMELVDEQDRPSAGLAQGAGLGDQGPHVGHAAGHRASAGATVPPDSSAMSRARVVLPLPGGPQNTRLGR